MFYDCHMHSNFSGDSTMDPINACEVAINMGLKAITFTDHLDFDFPGFDKKFLINFNEYSKYMDKLKIKYKDRLKVLKGIEVGIQSHVIDETTKIINNYKFDAVIASLHCVDKNSLHTNDYTKDKSKKDSYLGYLNELYNVLTQFDNYDILGHIDLIRRYGNYKNNLLYFDEYKEVLDAILRLIIKKQKCLEVNTSGYRYKLDSPMPSIDILKWYKKIGGKLLCLGSDAHFPQHIAYKFNYVKILLKDLGFSCITYYEGREPQFLNI